MLDFFFSRKIPTMLEYFSYVFHFQALMAGPVIFYRDYIDFIHGRNIGGTKTLTVSFLFFLIIIICVLKKKKKKEEKEKKIEFYFFPFKGYDKNSTHYDEIVLEPSPTPVVIKKVIISLLFAALFVTFIPSYSIQKLKGSTRIFFFNIYYYRITLPILTNKTLFYLQRKIS